MDKATSIRISSVMTAIAYAERKDAMNYLTAALAWVHAGCPGPADNREAWAELEIAMEWRRAPNSAPTDEYIQPQ